MSRVWIARTALAAGLLVAALAVTGCSLPGGVEAEGSGGGETPAAEEALERLRVLEGELREQRGQLTELNARLDILTKELEALRRDREWRQARARARLDFTFGQHPGQVVTVYYWDGGDTLQPVEVLAPADRHPLRAAVEAWVRGAPEYGLDSGLGSYPELIGFRVEDGVAYLDFDERFDDFPGGSAWTVAVQTSLTYTVTEIEGIASVVVTVNGEPAMLHGTIWDSPRQRLPLHDTERLAPVIRYDGPGRPRE